mgnify:FL=1
MKNLGNPKIFVKKIPIGSILEVKYSNIDGITNDILRFEKTQEIKNNKFTLEYNKTYLMCFLGTQKFGNGFLNYHSSFSGKGIETIPREWFKFFIINENINFNVYDTDLILMEMELI